MRQPPIFSDFKGIAFALTIVVGFETGVPAIPALPLARMTTPNAHDPLVKPIDTRPDRHCHNVDRFVYCYKKDPNKRESEDSSVRHNAPYRHWRMKRSHHELKRRQ
jgi:hypothetical protein